MMICWWYICFSLLSTLQLWPIIAHVSACHLRGHGCWRIQTGQNILIRWTFCQGVVESHITVLSLTVCHAVSPRLCLTLNLQPGLNSCLHFSLNMLLETVRKHLLDYKWRPIHLCCMFYFSKHFPFITFFLFIHFNNPVNGANFRYYLNIFIRTNVFFPSLYSVISYIQFLSSIFFRFYFLNAVTPLIRINSFTIFQVFL